MMDLAKFPHVLLDLDGTICSENEPLPGAIKLIERFTQTRRSFGILSNSASSPQTVQQRLHAMSIHVSADRIFTAAERRLNISSKNTGHALECSISAPSRHTRCWKGESIL